MQNEHEHDWHLTSIEIFGEKRYAVCRKDGVYTEYATRYLPKADAEDMLRLYQNAEKAKENAPDA